MSNTDSSKIGGNAPSEAKKFVHHVLTDKLEGPGFARMVGRRFAVTEVSYIEKAEEPERMECRTVVEITVEDGEWQYSKAKVHELITFTFQKNSCEHTIDMVNFFGFMHGGCTAYIIDM